MGFETSDIYIAPRPVLTVGLSEGACALATPPYANPDHTYIITAPTKNLMALYEAKETPKFWREDTLIDYRFKKSVGRGVSFPMTMPRLTLGWGEEKYPMLTLDNSTLIRFLDAQGATEIPVALRVLEGAPLGFATASLESREKAVTLDFLYRARTMHDEAGTNFTTFLPIEELETYINDNLITARLSLRSQWDGNEHSQYREFIAAAAQLDHLIANGAPGVWVKNPRDIFSVTEGMRDIMGQGDMTPVRDLPPMEWIDRFTRLYERHIHYCDHVEPGRYVDMTPRQRVDALAAPMVEVISGSSEAMQLARRQLSDVAREYMRTLPKVVTAQPKPASAEMAYEI